MADKARQVDFLLSGVINDNGQQKPLAGGKVYAFEPGTTTPATNFYQDADKTLAHAHPAILDNDGKLTGYVDGKIKFRIDDAQDNVVDTFDNLDYSILSTSSGLAIQTISTNYTALTTDGAIFASASSGNVTVTLPAAANNSGQKLIIKKTDSSANTVTIDGNASETIDESATKVLTIQYDSVVLVCDGSNWWVTAQAVQTIPSGLISIWSGAISAIPTGWLICDGTSGTPDLSSSFVIHADADSGGTYDVGDTGGAATHTLTASEMPAHTHTYTRASNQQGTQAGGSFNCPISSDTPNTGSAGSGSAHNNMPPYYALAYIMKS